MDNARQIVLDTETTGLEPGAGHRIVEIACLELVGRTLTGEQFHRYVNPGRKSDPRALEVHGLSDAFLADKPRFGEIREHLCEFVRGAEVIIHNAEFDLAFLDAEMERLGLPGFVEQTNCKVCDSLALARNEFPGLQNSIDALSDRFSIDRSSRDEHHGALVDADLLARIYLAMTGGQTAMFIQAHGASGDENLPQLAGLGGAQAGGLPVIPASPGETARHGKFLDRLERESRKGCIWPKN
ncbi:MAG: DNA polymerase III subunit epsilon [Gammaproteobacteria bacterium]|nr:DNA polymerase III subunit epsilon [Gammaproteobacteria bacterium]MDD9807232.1 DNA polymerase III subunit epsilon [Gammaproteobacteria bacterium]MDD9868520.1 DNA polymerase III subunit epsilon [Gammaproteobacteria bacterium]MDD9886664.1 DNA polymerase III subunit epsilon [Gammaproteobacteria bacterium]